MMNHSLIASASLLGLVLKSSPAEAHGGGLDAYGCHTNHKTGDYHCHGGGHSRDSYRPSYRAPKPTNRYIGQKVELKPAVDFTYVGTSFQDPTDSNYTYCSISGGYGISKGGMKTGVATEGSSAFSAIKAVEPAHVWPTLPPTAPTAPIPTPLERPSIYEYWFRSLLGVMSFFYMLSLFSKDVQNFGCGGHLFFGSVALWSILCAVGVVSISTFLYLFIAVVVLFIAAPVLIGLLFG